MTIKKLWLSVLIFISLIAIGINALIFSTLTDKYFMTYLNKEYEKNVEKIIFYVKSSLSNNETSYKQMIVELEIQLKEPIVGIKLYSPKGDLLIETFSGNNSGGMGKMKGMGQKEVNEYPIVENGKPLGTLHIIKHGSAKTSMIGKMFKSTLLSNSILSIIVALIFSIIIGIIVSKKMSKALIKTAEFADSIQLGVKEVPEKSSIQEINRIRESLYELDTRLKIKQKNRKELVDQLIHQTRTPLSILKSHLEGIEDGIIEMNDKEIGVWAEQLQNMSSIITNMSGMIDANKENDNINSEKVDMAEIINQIINSLKPQFDKKNIEIICSKNFSLEIETDKYKLSQILYNLLTNAYKYSPNNTSVEIELIKLENEIQIKISDKGYGIKEEELPRIFDAYYRGSGLLEIHGDGIGLYVVKENLKQINGSIEVFSKYGSGTRFELLLPIKF